MIILLFLILGVAVFAQTNSNNYYYANQERQYWQIDSSSVNIIVADVSHYNDIVDNLKNIFNEEFDTLRPCLVDGKEYSILNRIPCELKGENGDNYSNALSCCMNKKYKILSASVQTYHDKSYFQPQLLSSQDSVEGVGPTYGPFGYIGQIGMLGAVLCAHNEDSLVFMADTLLGCIPANQGKASVNS